MQCYRGAHCDGVAAIGPIRVSRQFGDDAGNFVTGSQWVRDPWLQLHAVEDMQIGAAYPAGVDSDARPTRLDGSGVAAH
jgi:hypothetical protein